MVGKKKKDGLHCTSGQCRAIILEPNDVFVHPRLNVIICERCATVMLAGEWDVGEDGFEDFCTWCGNGHESLVCCDNHDKVCPKTFCKDCITFSFGEKAYDTIMSLDGELMQAASAFLAQFTRVSCWLECPFAR